MSLKKYLKISVILLGGFLAACALVVEPSCPSNNVSCNDNGPFGHGGEGGQSANNGSDTSGSDAGSTSDDGGSTSNDSGNSPAAY